MIISRTPFRISFVGGGTDLPSFYEQEGGAVVSTAIDKYIYITINDRFDSTYRLSYSRTEIVEGVQQIEHPIFRTVLQKLLKDEMPARGLEVISMADIPAGTGLGSSSSFTVGLINALSAHLGRFSSASDLSEQACQVEIQDLREPIGKQDQYAAAFGGLRSYEFHKNGQVTVNPIVAPVSYLQDFENSFLLFYTGVTRSASALLKEQKENVDSKLEELRGLKGLASEFCELLQSAAPLEKVGGLLDKGWRFKREMAKGVSNKQIDDWYDRGIKAGAWGGKILGAGGGGFLLLMAPSSAHAGIRRALPELREIPFRFTNTGSQIIFVG